MDHGRREEADTKKLLASTLGAAWKASIWVAINVLGVFMQQSYLATAVMMTSFGDPVMTVCMDL